jgi:hypothetical protein
MPEDTPGAGGRPPWEPTAEERGKVAAWAEAGYTQEDIADRLDIDPKTLRLRCRKELDFGTRAIRRKQKRGPRGSAAEPWCDLLPVEDEGQKARMDRAARTHG